MLSFIGRRTLYLRAERDIADEEGNPLFKKGDIYTCFGERVETTEETARFSFGNVYSDTLKAVVPVTREQGEERIIVDIDLDDFAIVEEQRTLYCYNEDIDTQTLGDVLDQMDTYADTSRHLWGERGDFTTAVERRYFDPDEKRMRTFKVVYNGGGE